MFCLEEPAHEVKFFQRISDSCEWIWFDWNYRPVGCFVNAAGEIERCLWTFNRPQQWYFYHATTRLFTLDAADPKNVRWVEQASFPNVLDPRRIMQGMGEVDETTSRRTPGSRLTPNRWYPITILARNPLLCGANYAIEFLGDGRCFRHKIARSQDSLLCRAAAHLATLRGRTAKRKICGQLPVELNRLVNEFRRTNKLPDAWV